LGGNHLTKVEPVCPYFKKQIVVERNHFGVGERAHSLQDKQPGRIARPGALPGWMSWWRRIMLSSQTARRRPGKRGLIRRVSRRTTWPLSVERHA